MDPDPGLRSVLRRCASQLKSPQKVNYNRNLFLFQQKCRLRSKRITTMIFITVEKYSKSKSKSHPPSHKQGQTRISWVAYLSEIPNPLPFFLVPRQEKMAFAIHFQHCRRISRCLSQVAKADRSWFKTHIFKTTWRNCINWFAQNFGRWFFVEKRYVCNFIEGWSAV